VDNLAIEDLLPACLEIENPDLATAQSLPRVKASTDWCAARDIRDDRLLLFTGRFQGRRSYCYAARAVTPGAFVVPSINASCMYDPETRSAAGRGRLTVTR